MTLPELVLLFALQDVVTGSGPRKLASYSFATNASLKPGVYVAELDGTRLELSISQIPSKPGAFLVSRSYYRPGQTLLRKSYINLAHGSDGHWEGRGGLKLRIPQDAKQGPVVLELSSGVEAIPSTLWIQYRPK